MAVVSGSGHPARFPGGGASWLRTVAVVFALGASLTAQNRSAPGPSARNGKAPLPAPTRPSPTESANPASAPATLPPLQAPAHAPLISWDGKQLTVDAENSSLSDILLGIRSHTGASIEMPMSTDEERIAVHLGPAPIREVLSALLYGTNYNYVIQASEGDENGLGKVILSSRDGDHNDQTAAGETRDPNIRLMPGYGAPNKRDFEVAHSNSDDDTPSPAAESPAAPDSAVTAESIPSTDSVAPTPTGDSPPVASTTESTDPSPSAETALTAAGQTVSNNQAETSSASAAISGTGGPPTMSQMEQNLQKMYQQRQQLQAQQNRPAPPSTP